MQHRPAAAAATENWNPPCAAGCDIDLALDAIRVSDHDEVLPTMISTRMKGRERIYHKQPGGGGYGDPLERVPAAVAWDVKNDKVSLEAAHEQYGVILNEQTLEVDEAATKTVRRQMRSRH